MGSSPSFITRKIAEWIDSAVQSFSRTYYGTTEYSTAIAVDTTLVQTTHGGSLIRVTGTDKTITLPAAVTGVVFRIMSFAADGAGGTVIDPDAAETITGCGSNGVATLTNTKATSRKGDYIELIGLTGTGWFVTKRIGTWA